MNCRRCISKKDEAPCEYEIPGQEFWEINGEQYNGCPLKIVTVLSANFLRAFNFYKAGFWPNAGGWLDQPAKLLDAFDAIERELHEVETEKERRRSKFTP